MKHILFIITSASKVGVDQRKTGYEFSEVADPYMVFAENGYTVDFASLLGGMPPEDGYDSTHENSKIFRESSGFKRLNFSHKLVDVDIESYDAIFFPGGLGPLVDLVNTPLVKEIIRKTYESGNIIGAVCHGPAALLNVRLSDGSYLVKEKKINCFTEAEEKEKGHHLENVIPFFLDHALSNQGAHFSHGKPFAPYVVVDNKLVTGQNPASAMRVADEMVKLLTSS